MDLKEQAFVNQYLKKALSIATEALYLRGLVK